MVIFLCNLDMFVWKQHGCLANTIFRLDLSNRVIKRLWYMVYTHSHINFSTILLL